MRRREGEVTAIVNPLRIGHMEERPQEFWHWCTSEVEMHLLEGCTQTWRPRGPRRGQHWEKEFNAPCKDR